MSPIGVGSSNSSTILKTGEAKLWLLLVGVNEYLDTSLPSLRYPALDCQGLEKALFKATAGFPNKEVIVHHDFAAQPPSLERIRSSLQKIVSQSQSQDSILLYFSGHGVVEPNTSQAVLCFPETRKDDLLNTGLAMQELVQILGASSANQQLVCLDTCHSGDMNLLRQNGGNRDGTMPDIANPTPQLMDVLRQRAAQSKGFCALLSCDRGQQSWEFPELGHGVFTYYLMQGLMGEAADADGFIEADGLYKYVYHKTVQYIDKLNHQVRLINQQKLNRGESKLHPEYPQQTPKRIVEGVGDLIVGFQPVKTQSHKPRRALVIDGLSNRQTTADLSRLFAGAGGFQVDYFPQKGQNWSEIRGKIQEFTRWVGESETKSSSQLGAVKKTRTSLLYLRGYIEEIEDGEAWLILGDGMRLSRSLLRQELRRAQKTQQIVIVDLVRSDSSIPSLENWIEDLQFGTEHGQCLIVAATPASESELFSQTLLESLVTANPQVELSIAKWITELQKLMLAKGIDLRVWLSGTQSVIDILPGNISSIFQDFQKLETDQIKENKQENVTIPLSSLQLPKEETLELIPLASSFDSLELQAKKTQLNLVSGSQEYINLEQLFKQSIGPIAPTILEETVMQVATCQELVDKLAAYLSPAEQQQFVKRAMTMLESTNSPQVQLAKSAIGYQIIDADFIRKCENEFAYLVGPIANFIIEEILQSQPQISASEFASKLAKLIPDTKKAVEFERRILDK